MSSFRHFLLAAVCGLNAFGAHAATGDFSVVSKSDTLKGPKQVTIEARVLMPGGRASADAIVIVNSSSGREDEVMGAMGQTMVGAGIAVVLLDTYTPRGIRNSAANQEQVTYIEQFADIFAVLQTMRVDPRFAGRKIALSGHSRGATLAYMTAYKEFQAYYQEPAPLFDAYVGLSADCLPTFKTLELNGPLHLVSGEKDNWTRPEPCQRHVTSLIAVKQPASIEIIPGVNHSFSFIGYNISNGVKFACPVERDYYHAQRERFESPMKVLDSEKTESETPSALWKRCAGTFGINGRGANAGGDRSQMPKAINSAIQFLQANGWK